MTCRVDKNVTKEYRNFILQSYNDPIFQIGGRQNPETTA
jgi:hypothetical protein